MRMCDVGCSDQMKQHCVKRTHGDDVVCGWANVTVDVVRVVTYCAKDMHGDDVVCGWENVTVTVVHVVAHCMTLYVAGQMLQ